MLLRKPETDFIDENEYYLEEETKQFLKVNNLK